MAIRSLPYNHTLARFASGDFQTGHVYKLNLYSAFTFNAAATTKAAAEVGCTQLATGLGYIQNDKVLTGVAVTITGNDAFWDADNVQWIASGGTIAATWALMFNDSLANDPPVLAVDFDGLASAAAGAPFDVIWASSGIINYQTL